jgi:hypothetical protein
MQVAFRVSDLVTIDWGFLGYVDATSFIELVPFCPQKKQKKQQQTYGLVQVQVLHDTLLCPLSQFVVVKTCRLCGCAQLYSMKELLK